MSPPPQCRAPSRPSRALAAVFLVLAALCCLPLLVPSVPPLSDYPNHLARIHLLAHLSTIPALQPFYQVAWAPVPNLGFDIIGMVLASVMPTIAAGTLILVGTVLSIGGGVVALSAELHGGRPRPVALAGFLFVLSQPVYLGFVGFMIGMALCLWAVVLWLRLAHRPIALRLAAAVAIGLVLFFAHLFALAVFGVIVGFLELHALRVRTLPRTAILLAAPFLLPAAIYLPSIAAAPGTAATYWVREWTDVLAILVSPVSNGSVELDVATMALVYGLLALGLVTRRLVIAPPLRLALPFMALLSLAMPEMLASSYYAHLRLPTYTLLLLCAGLDWRAGPRALAVGATVLVAVLGLRMGVLTQHFAERGAFLDRLRAAFADAPPGLRVASVAMRRPGDGVEPGWDHGICLLVIDRSAYVANVFTTAGQQPLRNGPAATGADLPRAWRPTGPDPITPSMLEGLDRMVLINPEVVGPTWPSNLERVQQAEGFDVYRIRPEP